MGIGDDERVGIGQGGDRGEVRGIPGGQDQPGRRTGERGEGGFELGVDGQRAGDQAGGAGPAAVGLGSLDGPGDDPRVGAQAEVVVAGQVEQARIGDRGAAHEAALRPHPGSVGQPVEEVSHGGDPLIRSPLVRRAIVLTSTALRRETRAPSDKYLPI